MRKDSHSEHAQFPYQMAVECALYQDVKNAKAFYKRSQSRVLSNPTERSRSERKLSQCTNLIKQDTGQLGKGFLHPMSAES